MLYPEPDARSSAGGRDISGMKTSVRLRGPLSFAEGDSKGSSIVLTPVKVLK
jgi:hypothetical protein